MIKKTSKQCERSEHYQQGDVLLFKLDKEKGETKGTLLKTKVVQEGEHTGHAHRLVSGDVQIYGDDQGNRKYLKVMSPQATLTHEEHLPTIIEEGEYEIRIVRQKDPFTKLISKVID